MKPTIFQASILALSVAGALFVLESCTTVSTSASAGQGSVAGGGSNPPVAHPPIVVAPPVAAAGTPIGTEAKPSFGNLGNNQYPRIETDGKVTFRFRAPDATKVQVSIVGSAGIDMTKGEDGFWTYTTP